MRDYMPRNPETVTGWLDRFTAYLSENYERLGLTEDDLARVGDLNSRWETAYDEQVAARTAFHAKTRTRNNVQAEIGEVLRPLIRRIQAAPATNDVDRNSLGITVYGATNTTSGAGLGVAGSRPLMTIDTRQRLQHKMKVQYQTMDGAKYGKPAGVIGCEVYRKIGEAPASDAELEMVGVATRSTYTLRYPIEAGGQMVHYMTRWVNSKGERGPWSETKSATIAA